MDQCGPCLKRRRHDSEQSVSSGTSSCSSALEYTDLEAAEALVCMSSWGQPVFLGGGGGNKLNTCKPRPLTPASDSCDSLLPLELQESPRDFVSLSSLVRAGQTVRCKPIKSQFSYISYAPGYFMWYLQCCKKVQSSLIFGFCHA